jgi:hypothetical protein
LYEQDQISRNIALRNGGLPTNTIIAAPLIEREHKRAPEEYSGALCFTLRCLCG